MSQKQIRELSNGGAQFENPQGLGSRKIGALRKEVEDNASVDLGNEWVIGDELRNHILSPRFQSTPDIEFSLPPPDYGLRERNVSFDEHRLGIRHRQDLT